MTGVDLCFCSSTCRLPTGPVVPVSTVPTGSIETCLGPRNPSPPPGPSGPPSALEDEVSSCLIRIPTFYSQNQRPTRRSRSGILGPGITRQIYWDQNLGKLFKISHKKFQFSDGFFSPCFLGDLKKKFPSSADLIGRSELKK